MKDKELCDYCGVPAEVGEPLMKCGSCDFLGHSDCLSEHHTTEHDVIADDSEGEDGFAECEF